MQFSCASCRKMLKLPDASVPSAPKFAIPCPFCKEKIIVDKSDPDNPVTSLANPPAPAPEPHAAGGEGSEYGGGLVFEDDLPPEPAQAPMAEAEGNTSSPVAKGSGLADAFAPIDDGVPGEGSAVRNATAQERTDSYVHSGDAPNSTTAQSAAAAPPPSPARPVQQSVQAAQGLEPEIFPPGAQVAFLAVGNPAWASPLKSFFKERGYHVSEAAGAAVGLAKLRLNAYQAVVLEEGEMGEVLLAEINHWPGARRRDTLVLYIGTQGDSLDPRPGFSLSVNGYLRVGDAQKASRLLTEVVAGYEAHYELWRMAEGEQKQD